MEMIITALLLLLLYIVIIMAIMMVINVMRSLSAAHNYDGAAKPFETFSINKQKLGQDSLSDIIY